MYSAHPSSILSPSYLNLTLVDLQQDHCNLCILAASYLTQSYFHFDGSTTMYSVYLNPTFLPAHQQHCFLEILSQPHLMDQQQHIQSISPLSYHNLTFHPACTSDPLLIQLISTLPKNSWWCHTKRIAQINRESTANSVTACWLPCKSRLVLRPWPPRARYRRDQGEVAVLPKLIWAGLDLTNTTAFWLILLISTLGAIHKGRPHREGGRGVAQKQT